MVSKIEMLKLNVIRVLSEHEISDKMIASALDMTAEELRTYNTR